jgi:hypothetical protein
MFEMFELDQDYEFIESCISKRVYAVTLLTLVAWRRTVGQV